MQLKIGSIVAKRGEKSSGYVSIPGTNIEIPITLIAGESAGKTVLITSGVHNSEYTGIETAIQLAQEFLPVHVAGNIIIIHPLNISGFENRTMSVVAEDGKNLNRIFPGDPNGTEGDKISNFIATVLEGQTDFLIDLHAGDGYETLTPYVYYVGAAEMNVVKESKAMAEKVNVPFMVQSFISTGGLYNYAGTCGIPSILIERGGEARWTEPEIELYKEDVKNVLRHLSVLEGKVKINNHRPVEVTNVCYENASATGCWYPCKQVGDRIKIGEVLGVIKDYFGNTLQTCRAKSNGIILYQVSSLCIIRNGSMITYGKINR
ncbi:M14 family metallopeptidase [Acetobacterium wieringae]|uniref:M14 family metallopeptidase n=1 Tax=Acetobacterium wieringae TaxID=52694 RepID=UPI0026F0352F|nr:M14 family metallopeptidase [Acetobacterium wieringae]